MFDVCPVRAPCGNKFYSILFYSIRAYVGGKCEDKIASCRAKKGDSFLIKKKLIDWQVHHGQAI